VKHHFKAGCDQQHIFGNKQDIDNNVRAKHVHHLFLLSCASLSLHCFVQVHEQNLWLCLSDPHPKQTTIECGDISFSNESQCGQHMSLRNDNITLLFNKQNVVTERTGMALTVFNIHSAFVLIRARDFVQESEQQRQHVQLILMPKCTQAFGA